MSCGQTISMEHPSEQVSVGSQVQEPSKSTMPKALQTCAELRIQGKMIIFKNERDETVVSVMKTGKGLVPSALDYLDGSSGESFMNSRSAKGQGIRHAAFDKDDRPIGSVGYLTGLRYAMKTVVSIQTAEGETILLEENVGGLFRKIAKLFGMFMNTGILSGLLGDRTGDLIIKRGKQTVGVVRSIRQSRFNTYIVENCDQLRSTLDIRLIVLGLTMKQIVSK
ncbi:hypothetical protein L1N85_16105 [Paenibacillus alkaliterrae]|uniref:hypothetical protein n=1 Tax=Paenibacillus alkaliterrae TaxID=320909 RepID=UPI001F371AB1|nr:hypothetical protein [Paenibacillus alkaliterrae]MCF2939941.1 hypothetical protein [Paenibacillus alkaliterrae]